MHTPSHMHAADPAWQPNAKSSVEIAQDSDFQLYRKVSGQLRIYMHVIVQNAHE